MENQQLDTIYFVRLRCIPRRCPGCGNPAPLNTLTTEVVCPECDGAVPVAAKAWNALLGGAIQLPWCRGGEHELEVGADREGTAGAAARVEGAAQKGAPGCVHCAAPLVVDWDLPAAETVDVSCPACDRVNRLLPLPDWARPIALNATHFLSLETGEANAADSASPLELDRDSPTPVALDCENCGSKLTIDHERSRLTECDYCGTSFYLPRDVWRRFHPVATAQPLFVRARFDAEDFRRAGRRLTKIGLACIIFGGPLLAFGPVVGVLGEWDRTGPVGRLVWLALAGLLAAGPMILGRFMLRDALRHYRDAGRITG